MSDLISRQAAIDATKKHYRAHDNDLLELIAFDIEQLPPIQPKRGKWERHYSRPNVYADLFWHCSECGYKDIENYAPVYHHFCPNCGAKMQLMQMQYRKSFGNTNLTENGGVAQSKIYLILSPPFSPTTTYRN